MRKASSRLFAYAVAAPLCFALAGCDTLSEHVKPSSPMTATHSITAPRTQSGDKIKLVVYGEDKMSGDYEIAVEEGATVVRVGQAIFGARPTPDSEYWPST